MTFKRLKWASRLTRVLFFLVVAGASSVSIAPAQDTDGVTDDVRIQRILIRSLTRLYIEDHEGAIQALNQGLELHPLSPALLATMGRVQQDLGDTASALFYLQRALALDRDNPELWRRLAETALDAGDAHTAVSALVEVALLVPDNIGSQLDLVRLLIRLEQYEEAAGAVGTALTHIGFDPALLTEKAEIEEQLGDSEALAATLTQLIEFQPTNLEHRYRLGALHFRAGMWEMAQAAYEDILKIDTDQIEASRSLAGVLDRQGKSDRAAAILSSLPGARREHTGQLNDEEKFSGGIGENDDRSAEDLLRRLEMDKMDSEALLSLAALMASRREYAEAASLYRRHVSFSPRSLESWIRGIAAYISAGDPEEALSFADEGLSLFPSYIPIQIEQANALIATNRKDEARSLLNDLRSRADEQAHRARILAMLNTLEG